MSKEEFSFRTILVDKDEETGITTITLNRPKKKNTLTIRLLNETVEALEKLKSEAIMTYLYSTLYSGLNDNELKDLLFFCLRNNDFIFNYRIRSCAQVGRFIPEKKIFLSELLDGILSKKEEIRFNSHETLLYISENDPVVLYPKWDYLAGLLTSANHFHRYIAINLIANLVKVDSENKFERDFDQYFQNIAGERTMVAGQAALNAGKITKAKPNLQAKITEILLKIDQIHQGKQTELMKAGAITAFNDYFNEAVDKDKIIDFVKTSLDSGSPKTRKVAKEFLHYWVN